MRDPLIDRWLEQVEFAAGASARVISSGGGCALRWFVVQSLAVAALLALGVGLGRLGLPIVGHLVGGAVDGMVPRPMWVDWGRSFAPDDAAMGNAEHPPPAVGSPASSPVPPGAKNRPRRLTVTEAKVREAIPPGKQPAAVWVPARQGRPGGLELTRVGALDGLVFRGDILFEVEGRPIGGWEVVVQAVRGAYERKARAARGKLWRRGEAFDVTVELPR